MLRCREARAEKQRSLLAQFARPLLCFSMNIPGPVKTGPLIALAFEEGLRRLLLRVSPVFLEKLYFDTGPEAYLVADMSAEELKRIATEIEEGEAPGRLFDMDVLLPSGEKLMRENARSCLVCGGAAAACARSRAHGLQSVLAKVRALLEDCAAAHYAQAAYTALCAEALTTPKPGLVDAQNNGAHSDMCLSTLLKSAAALVPFFKEAFLIGLAGENEKDVMPALRKAGLEAEKSMLAAAGGVNAHKGAIYAFGLLIAAQGMCIEREGDALDTAAVLAAYDMEAQLRLAKAQPRSHGERIYAALGLKGARGEAAAGFPHARLAAAALERHARYGKNEAAALALCEIMCVLDDTNLLHRGGVEGLSFAKNGAKTVLKQAALMRMEALRKLDEEMILRGLSPGGAADMLALGIYLSRCGAEQTGTLQKR